MPPVGKLTRLRLLVGGASPPLTLIRRLAKHGVDVTQGWGLTESSPEATTNQMKAHMRDWSDEDRFEVKAKAGICVPFVDVRVVNEEGEIPRDDRTMGEVQLRGPWVAASYRGNDRFRGISEDR